MTRVGIGKTLAAFAGIIGGASTLMCMLLVVESARQTDYINVSTMCFAGGVGILHLVICWLVLSAYTKSSVQLLAFTFGLWVWFLGSTFSNSIATSARIPDDLLLVNTATFGPVVIAYIAYWALFQLLHPLPVPSANGTVLGARLDAEVHSSSEGG